jgi:hypothetical protein
VNLRRPLLMLAMTVTPPEPGGPPVQPPAPVPAPPAVPPGYLSQQQVNDLMARQATEGAAKYLKQQLGVDDLAAAKDLIAAAKKSQADQMTAEQQAGAAKEAAEKVQAEAAAERVLFRKQSALLTAGMPLQTTGADGKVVDNPQLKHALRLLDVDPAADQAAVAAAVTQLKAEMPTLFAAPVAAPTGNPGPPPRTPAGGTPGAAGTARAEQYASRRPGMAARTTP